MKSRKGRCDIARDLLVGSKHLERSGKPTTGFPICDGIGFVPEPTRERDLRPLSAHCPQQLTRHPFHAPNGSPFPATIWPTAPREKTAAPRFRLTRAGRGCAPQRARSPARVRCRPRRACSAIRHGCAARVHLPSTPGQAASIWQRATAGRAVVARAEAAVKPSETGRLKRCGRSAAMRSWG